MFFQLHSVFMNAGAKYVGVDLTRVVVLPNKLEEARGVKLLKTFKRESITTGHRLCWEK